MKRLAPVLVAALILGLATVGGGVWAAFTSTASSQANTFSAAPDFVAPATDAVIGKTAGGVPGYIRQGGTYYVYGNSSDSGNPASGISTVRANTTAFDTGVTAAALNAGTFSTNGVSYNRRTASLTANASLAAGSYNYTVTSTDVAGNAETETFQVTVDNTAPAPSDVQTANGGSIAGRPEQNDTIVFTSSEQLDANSVLAGWTGAALDCVVRINNGASGVNDSLLVYNSANSTQLRLGTVNLGRTDYVGANRTFGVTGTKSRITQSGGTITVVLGTQSGAGTTAAGTGSMIWTPVATATDRAGNAMPTTADTEAGAADAEF